MLTLLAYHYYDDECSSWRTALAKFDESHRYFGETIEQHTDIIYFFLEVAV